MNYAPYELSTCTYYNPTLGTWSDPRGAYPMAIQAVAPPPKPKPPTKLEKFEAWLFQTVDTPIPFRSVFE